MKGARNVSILIEKILRTVIDALERERLGRFEAIQLSLCSIVGDISRYFMNVFVKIILAEKLIPNGIMRKMLSFFDCVENVPPSQMPRFLRHLFPALYPFFLDEQSFKLCTTIAKDSKLGIFLIHTLRETFTKGCKSLCPPMPPMDPNCYFQIMKVAPNYINILRILVTKNEPLRLKLFQMDIIPLLLQITRRHYEFDSPAPLFIRCHSAIIKTFENLLYSASKTLPDEFVKHGAVQVC